MPGKLLYLNEYNYSMAKKKENKVKHIFVKKPKIGSNYYFDFAGGWEYGELIAESKKLTEHYGHSWYTLQNKNISGRFIKYPVSIYNLRNNKEETKK